MWRFASFLFQTISRRWLWLLLLLPIVGGSFVLACTWRVRAAAHGRSYTQVSALPEARTLLVLGCAPRVGRWPNRFFTYRIQAAVAVYRAGKAKAIIVSGDNHTPGYDEPSAMKAALIRAGVPGSRIHCDYAGFHTLDSVARAKSVFGQNRITIISQAMHNERALYLASQLGLDAIAYNAENVSGPRADQQHYREWLARVKAVLDVWVFGTQPRFLGPPVVID